MKRTAVIAMSIIGLTLAGCAGPEAEAKPTPTVTVTAEPEIKEVEVIKEVTPQSCIDALDLMTDMVTVFIGIQETVPPALEAAVKWDNAAIETLTSKIHRHNDELDALTAPMGVAAGGCRAAAQ